MLDYQQALDLVLENTTPLPPVTVALDDGIGKILAEDIHAERNLPAADNSAMDGYAFILSSLKDDRLLHDVGFLPAGGQFSGRIKAGEAVRIMTGAALPQGCDTVIPMEDTEPLPDSRIRLLKQPRPGDNVRYCGEEARQGDMILPAGTRLDAGALGLLAAAGISRVQVCPSPSVAVLSTGDELCELKDAADQSKIINSNSHLLSARLREDGFTPVLLGIAKDQPEDIERLLRQGQSANLLLSTGGVSVGDHDYVQEVLSAVGFEKIFWKVAIKPGKPVLFGKIKDLPVFGLPGNPAASAATYELFVRPALRRLAGYPDPLAPRLKVRLAEAVKGGGKRQQFMWGSVRIDQGYLSFFPSLRQGSGQNRSLQGSNALLPVAINAPAVDAGSEVDIILLRLPSSL